MEKTIKNAYPVEVEPTPVPRPTTFKLANYEVTLETNVTKPEPIVFFGESPFGIRGEFSFINGAPKAGKSFAVIPNLIASVVGKDVADLLGISVTLAQGEKIILIDTEQPRGHVKSLLEIAAKKANIVDTPAQIKIYALRGVPRADRKRAVFDIIEEHGPDIGVFILDGLADLLDDPNNAKASFELLEELSACAEQHNFAGIGYLHFNPGGEKMRGHAGSEAERKGAATISVVKNEDGTHYFKGKFFRYGEDLPSFPFRYNKEQGMFSSITDPAEFANAQKCADKDFQRKRDMAGLALAATTGGTAAYTNSEMIKALQSSDPKKRGFDSMKKMVQAMVQADILHKDDKNIYRFNEGARQVYF